MLASQLLNAPTDRSGEPEFGRLPSSLLNEGGGPLMAVNTKTTELTALDALPAVLSVEEAAALLRIGRTAAYALTRVWRATSGREGLPVVELGRSLRVPRAALIRMLDADGPSSREPVR